MPARLQLGSDQRKRARCQLSHTLPCRRRLFPQFYPRGSCDGSVSVRVLCLGVWEPAAMTVLCEIKHTHAVIFTTPSQNRLGPLEALGPGRLQLFSNVRSTTPFPSTITPTPRPPRPGRPIHNSQDFPKPVLSPW